MIHIVIVILERGESKIYIGTIFYVLKFCVIVNTIPINVNVVRFLCRAKPKNEMKGQS